MKRYIAAFVLLLSITVSAEDHDWDLKRDRDGVQVYTRDVEGSKFKSVKSTMMVETSLGALVALVRDSAACRDWAAHCKKAEDVEVISETELFVYTLNDLPWPVADRDAVTHVAWKQDPNDQSVTMTAIVVSSKLPKTKGVVRLTYGVTSWQFTPVGEKTVEVSSRAHLDPEGATPAWLSNRLLVGAPFETMIAMREIAQSTRYDNSQFQFLTEP